MVIGLGECKLNCMFQFQHFVKSFQAAFETKNVSFPFNLIIFYFSRKIRPKGDNLAARALSEMSIDNRKPLKTEGHLSRDPRAKERRKYGLKKARKAPQFSKR